MVETRQLPASRVIGAFRFVAVGAAATVAGYYVNKEGTNLGSFSTAVTTVTAVNLAGQSDGSGVPSDAVGAILKATGTVAYAPGGDQDLVAHPDRYPTFPTTFATLGQAA